MSCLFEFFRKQSLSILADDNKVNVCGNDSSDIMKGFQRQEDKQCRSSLDDSLSGSTLFVNSRSFIFCADDEIALLLHLFKRILQVSKKHKPEDDCLAQNFQITDPFNIITTILLEQNIKSSRSRKNQK